MAVRNIDDLRAILNLPVLDHDVAKIAQATDGFPIFAPREYVARMQIGDPQDPLLLQVLPSPAEADVVPGFGPDPVGDFTVARRRPDSSSTDGSADPAMDGVLHKYHGRALLMTTGACAVHCRYCFRRHFPYTEAPHGMADWQPAIKRIATDTTIEEVILSGGDPLTLRDAWLKELVEQLSEIPHVQRLRVHTRLPVMIPNRVNHALLDWLGGTRLVPVMVIHANHANELVGQDVESSLGRLVDAGIPTLNQAVLLRGINDNVEALESLSRQLLANRVIPYYLNQLDRVAGAAHFEVPVAEGRQLIQALRERLPGYMVPRYVVDRWGQASKTVLA